ncbi:hypothetical protein LR48_Vigan11g061500 [Vigna angularis]|uniref:Uncharacterized protein n=1 Tax=Phaseolus angularis TaxID=3914 RepID=A0A0L9VRU1_PHAAN|nr:hypothetical protein LR48_Vigan11g061500 [Vigna angularis]
MKLMKEVKRDRDGIGKGHKKCKRGENASTAQCQLPLSDTLKDPLAPLRGRMEHVLLPLSGYPVPPPQPPRAHRRAPQLAQELAHESAPFQMRDIYMSLMEERMNDLYRGEQELLRTLTSAFPKRQFISQEDFAARVAWPVAPSHTDDGVGATEASTMEEEAEDEEDSDDYD